MKYRKKTLFLCQGALVAACYLALTYLSRIFGLDSGPIQLRLAEILCILPIFMPSSVLGLTLGCFLANLLTAAPPLDVLIGPVATLIGALGTYLLRKYPLAALAPPILSNALIVPFVLAYGYGLEIAIPLMMLTVGVGELISVGVLGGVLYISLRKNAGRIFKC